MRVKPILGLALMLILIIPATLSNVSAVAVPDEPKKGKTFQFNGAGATFPFPLIDKWRVEYKKLYSDVSLNYQSIGSGGGVSQHTQKTIDFGASDAPLTPDEAKAAQGTLTIPETLGAVTVSYNVPDVPSGLKLTGRILADIYLGKILKWNDKRITDINSELKLPNKDIIVVRRSDGSGTTFVFTDYLSKVSKFWNDNIGKGKSVPWPVGVGAAGNEGVAGVVRNTKYSIGYVELAYAFQNKMTYANILNADGSQYVEPRLETTAAAAASAVTNLPESDADWSQVSITNVEGRNSYPISSFSYLLVYQDLDKIASMDKDKAKAMIHLIYWMVTSGQKYSSDLLYVSLPEEVQEVGKRGLGKVKFNGEQLFAYNKEGSEKASAAKIPSWIKNNAKWWSEGSINDGDFIKGVQYLIQQKIIIIPQTQQGTGQSQQIPSWIKNNAGWWANSQISDDDFVKGIQWLVTNGIINV